MKTGTKPGKDRENVSFPEVFQVEVTTRCNLNCTFCKARPDDVKQRGDLDYKTFEKVIDQLAGKIHRVNLWGAGEPMLHPEFFTMAKKAAGLGVRRIKVSTNGHFLSDENIKRILSSGITQIRIALDTSSPGEYARGRRGGDFHRVIKGIEKLCSAKAKTGVPLRVVVCSVTVDPSLLEDNPVRKLASSLGADAYEILHDIWDEQGIFTNVPPKERCIYPFKYFTLLAHGMVAPCCHVWHPDWILGNADEQPVEEIWYGQRTQKLRSIFLEGKFKYCSICNYYGPIQLRKIEKDTKDL